MLLIREAAARMTGTLPGLGDKLGVFGFGGGDPRGPEAAAAGLRELRVHAFRGSRALELVRNNSEVALLTTVDYTQRSAPAHLAHRCTYIPNRAEAKASPGSYPDRITDRAGEGQPFRLGRPFGQG